MIAAIVVKEIRELQRDGRVVGIASLIVLLVIIALLTGWSTHSAQVRQARRAQHEDQAAFLSQGSKSPHSAAHFGRMAYKPAPALAVFDPGISSYLGQVIWLEAHRQDPAMFRPAEDAPALRRLSDFSVAGILTTLVPLLAFLIGYASFAAERERGTLRQVLSAGPGIGSLFGGKLLAAAATTVGISVAVIAVCVLAASTTPGVGSVRDTLVRGAGLMAGYAAYGVIFSALALFVSAKARTAAAALLVLLSYWAVAVIIMPRVAASVADVIHPTPDDGAFWADTSRQISARGLRGDSAGYRALERQVVSRAMGREVATGEIASLPLNREALRLEMAELRGAQVYDEAFRELYGTYERQRRVRRAFSVLSPTIALQHLSGALAGTDVGAHRNFAMQAERQRNTIIRRMNEDMMLRGAGRGYDYLANRELWASIPDFHYEPPAARFAAQAVLWDALILVAWAIAAGGLAWRSTLRMS